MSDLLVNEEKCGGFFVLFLIQYLVSDGDRRGVNFFDKWNRRCSFFFFMSFRCNRDISFTRVFDSGDLFLCRWKFRLSTSDCYPNPWCRDIVWIFDLEIIGIVTLLE